ncbi:ABC transporter substrate-binding protein [Paenibacillus ginsengarvi]|uniref:Extracellular solute-binding protein n=1 Tax=Paenibacillus ginsengarvi TaxID=400777 RepID=A0A3B0AW71_9BACL|nr:extracellular solute-binding protein [Paenibacillus ginsengarvi]RKN64573.1 extracellular solute-binding protein [Paenibacillus ginsengarvi]
MLKVWKQCFVLMIIASVTSACTSKEASKIGNKGVGGESAKDWSKEPMELVFFANNMETPEDINSRYGDPLRKKFPNLTFKYIQATKGNTLQDLIAAGDRFDIFFNAIGLFESQAFENGIQYDMTDLIKAHNIDLNVLEPMLVNEIKRASGGKTYMLPVQNNNFVLYYNKELFNKFGVPYPKDGMTWDDMVGLSIKMSRVDEGTNYFGYSHYSGLTLRLNSLSIPISESTGSGMPIINKDERWKTIYQKYFIEPFHSPVYEDHFKKSGNIPNLSNFSKGNLAMFLYLSSLMQLADPYLKDVDWDVAAMPTLKENPGVGTQANPIYMGITKMAGNKDGAMEVLKYFISNEYQVEMARQGIIPSLKDKDVKSQLGASVTGSAKGKNWGAVFYNNFAPSAPMGPYDIKLASIYEKYADTLTKGKADLNTVLRQAEEESVKYVNEQKSK